MNLPWRYIYQKIKTRFYRGLILIITDVGTECGAQVCKMPIVGKIDDSLKKKKPLILYIFWYVIDCTL